MLFKLSDDLSELKPIAFSDFTAYKKREKHLEELLSNHLFEVLFEGLPLLPFHQERPYQPEGDIYALDRHGNVVIFELKVGAAEGGALDQVLRYAQVAGQWQYSEIAKKFKTYSKQDSRDITLDKAHQEAFGLEAPLKQEEFNRSQQMLVVGSAADTSLIQAVDYWKDRGLPIDFCPYRIFDISGDHYFEFFAKPYDIHTNPGEKKGILFDTNRTYYPSALEFMIKKKRIAAYGDRKDAVFSLSKGDIVFYSHRSVGLVAAARIVGNKPKQDNTVGVEELYWDVEFLTPIPCQFDSFPNAMPFQKVKEVTGKNFFWARTQKVPYLTAMEAKNLLDALNKHMNSVC